MRRGAPEVLHDELVGGDHDLGRARHGERLGLVEVDLPARGGAGHHLLCGVHVAVGVGELVEAHDEAACGDGSVLEGKPLLSTQQVLRGRRIHTRRWQQESVVK